MAPKALPATRNALIFVGVGSAILLATIAWLVLSLRGLDGTTRTDGTVVGDYDFDHKVVDFRAADGKTYSTNTSTRSVFHTYWNGDRVEVAYDPDNPADARVADFHHLYIGPLLVGGFGGLIAVPGLFAFFASRRKKDLRAWLEEHGAEMWLPVEYTRVNVVSRDSDTNRPICFIVKASWTDPTTRITHIAESDYLEEDPSSFLRGRGRVLVLYDPDDPSRNLLEFEPDPYAREQ